MKVRRHMITRYNDLKKTRAVEAVKTDDGKSFQVCFAGKVTLVVNEAEAKALGLEVREDDDGAQ